mmetsp:Transcript_17732/g.39705  ORF Transcript_17732/g.39705 Transcript_17732/m.39705 type:complete len:376 (-) Transcript_17732:403-1530(-)
MQPAGHTTPSMEQLSTVFVQVLYETLSWQSPQRRTPPSNVLASVPASTITLAQAPHNCVSPPAYTGDACGMLDANVVFVTRLLSSKNVHVDQDQAACEDECATHQQAYCRPVLYVAPHLQHEDNAWLLPAPFVVLAVRSFTQRASPSVQASVVPLWWAAKRVLGELPQVDGGRRRSQLAVVAVEESASGVAHDRSPPASTVSDAEGRPRVEQLCSEISKALLLQRDLIAIVRRGHVHAALAEESEYTHIRRLARDAHGGVNEIVGIKRSLVAAKDCILLDVTEVARRVDGQNRRVKREVWQRSMRVQREHSPQCAAGRAIHHIARGIQGKDVQVACDADEVAGHRVEDAHLHAEPVHVIVGQLLREHERRDATAR